MDKNILIELNAALSRYIEVHDSVFTQKFGQKIDYDNLVEKLRTVSDTLNKLKLAEFENSNLNNAVDIYIDALLITINQLSIIITKLEEKANGGGYGFFAYRKDLKVYNNLEKQHASLGSSLNTFV